MAAVLDRFYGTGRRKTSVARVWVRPGSGRIAINKRTFEDYFPRETLRMIIAQPFEITSTAGQFDVIVTVAGGGPTGQAGAVRHGLARALTRFDEKLRLAAEEGRAPDARSAHARAEEVRSAGRPAEVPVLQALSPVATTDRLRVAVAGASGYMGAELLRILLASPARDAHRRHLRAAGRRAAGSCLPASARAHRAGVSRPRRRAGSRTSPTSCSWRCRTWSRSARCRCCGSRGRKVIDLSADYRLRDPQRLRHVVQGAAHRSATGSGTRCTGCPSCIARRSRGASLVASPGCYPVGAILALAPLFKNGLARLDGIVIDGKSGVTGAGAQGRKVDPMYLFTEANENVQAYGIGVAPPHAGDRAGARRRWPAARCKVSFTPHLVPLNRGLFTTASVALASALRDGASCSQVYRDFYAGESFVRVLGEGERPTTRFVVGSNYCDVAVVADPRTGRAVCVSAHRQPRQGRLRQRRAEPQRAVRVERADRARHGPGVPLSRMPEIEWLDGGITAVPGFLAGGVAGWYQGRAARRTWRSSTPRRPTRSAAVFTSNQVKGAPVQVSMEHARWGAAQAIVASSGCAERLHRRARRQGRARDGQDRRGSAPHPDRARADRRDRRHRRAAADGQDPRPRCRSWSRRSRRRAGTPRPRRS